MQKESTIMLEFNWMESAGKQSLHLNIHHFFIRDVAKKGKLVIGHCNTKDMVAEFITKSLQGLE